MRRSDREVTSIEDIERIMKQCLVCHLAIHHTPYPYIVPLNFGYTRVDQTFSLFFHGAPEGEKLRLIRLNPFVSFAMEANTRLIAHEKACAWSMEYESVCGNGIISVIPDQEKSNDEKVLALEAIMRQCAPDQAFQIDREAVSSVTVLRLNVLQITGKQSIHR